MEGRRKEERYWVTKCLVNTLAFILHTLPFILINVISCGVKIYYFFILNIGSEFAEFFPYCYGQGLGTDQSRFDQIWTILITF